MNVNLDPFNDGRLIRSTSVSIRYGQVDQYVGLSDIAVIVDSTPRGPVTTTWFRRHPVPGNRGAQSWRSTEGHSLAPAGIVTALNDHERLIGMNAPVSHALAALRRSLAV